MLSYHVFKSIMCRLLHLHSTEGNIQMQFCIEGQTTQPNPLNPALNPVFNPSYRKSWNFWCKQWNDKNNTATLDEWRYATCSGLLSSRLIAELSEPKSPSSPQSDGGFTCIITKLLDYSPVDLQPEPDTKMWVFYSPCMFLFMSTRTETCLICSLVVGS